MFYNIKLVGYLSTIYMEMLSFQTKNTVTPYTLKSTSPTFCRGAIQSQFYVKLLKKAISYNQTQNILQIEIKNFKRVTAISVCAIEPSTNSQIDDLNRLKVKKNSMQNNI